MAQGVPTDESVIAEFRARYLYSGNASKSARECDLPESTGRDLAQRVSEEPEFVEARRKLRARALDDLVALRQRMAEEASSRFFDDTGGIDTKQFGDDKGATVVVTDKRHEYGKLVLDAEKNAQNLARIEQESKGVGNEPRRLEIILTDHAPELTVTPADDPQ